jgi:hypothetical protein
LLYEDDVTTLLVDELLKIQMLSDHTCMLRIGLITKTCLIVF